MYFVDDMTMDEIGHALGCSRATVSRLVNEAKTSGLVEIVVHRKGRAPSTLERVIGDRYGVRVTVVAPPPTATDNDRLRHGAAQGAALLRANLAPDLSVAVVWGVTVATVTPVCRRESCRGCRSCK
jgi:DNA-binding transcriptional regulator LsrR (DeoR family)